MILGSIDLGHVHPGRSVFWNKHLHVPSTIAFTFTSTRVYVQYTIDFHLPKLPASKTNQHVYGLFKLSVFLIFRKCYGSLLLVYSMLRI